MSAGLVASLYARMPGPRIEATEWATAFGDDLGRAWGECPRGDWLIWLAGILEAPHSMLALGAADCAEFSLSLLPLAAHEEVLRPLIAMVHGWVEDTVTAQACADAAKEVLAIYQGPQAPVEDESPTAGYATAAVSAAVTVPTFFSALGIAAAAAAAALAAAQVATPNDEGATADAHLHCAWLVRNRVPFEAVIATAAFKRYAEVAEAERQSR